MDEFGYLLETLKKLETWSIPIVCPIRVCPGVAYKGVTLIVETFPVNGLGDQCTHNCLQCHITYLTKLTDNIHDLKMAASISL